MTTDCWLCVDGHVDLRDAPEGYVLSYGEDPALLTGYDEWFWDEDLPLAGPELEAE